MGTTLTVDELRSAYEMAEARWGAAVELFATTRDHMQALVAALHERRDVAQAALLEGLKAAQDSDERSE